MRWVARVGGMLSVGVQVDSRPPHGLHWLQMHSLQMHGPCLPHLLMTAAPRAWHLRVVRVNGHHLRGGHPVAMHARACPPSCLPLALAG